MAEFRKLFYALGVAALFTGLSSTASAQNNTTVLCTSQAVPTIIRAEGFTELVGDYVLTCTGGVPTLSGLVVPQVNITVTINAPITSRILAAAPAGPFTEALLIIDDPNSATHPTRPLLACGDTLAPDTATIRGVCSILAPSDPNQTYSGQTGVAGSTNPGLTDSPCNGVDPDLVTVNNVTTNGPLPPRPANNTSYGCGRPNVFQGRQLFGQPNVTVFNGVPFNAPGSSDGFANLRTLRFTNFRVQPQNFAGGLVLQNIMMSVNINSPAAQITLNSPTVQVASVLPGISMLASGQIASFVQCNGVTGPSTVDELYRLGPQSQNRAVIFREGFPTAFKTKGLEQITGTANGNGNGDFLNNGWRLKTSIVNFSDPTYPTYVADPINFDQGGTRQNVPNTNYNTESGFTSAIGQVNYTSTNSGNNPPFPFTTDLGYSGGANLANQTGINGAGIATQGTRIAVRFSDLPLGSNLAIPNVVFLYPIGQGPVSGVNGGIGNPTGVAVRTIAGARGDGPFNPTPASSVNPGASLRYSNLAATATTSQIVYEVLFNDPNVQEDFYFPVRVTYTPNLASNLPAITVNTIPSASGGFAPFIDLTADNAATWASSQLASHTVSSNPVALPIPRFKPLAADKVDLFLIGKCSCNLLFPFVTNANTSRGNYDTGVAIANTSLLPNPTTGPFNPQGFANGTAQQGPVQLWYFPQNPADAANFPTQCTNAAVGGVCPGTKDVVAGATLTFSIAAGNPGYGIAPRPGFQGYMIAQTGFQYCHAFAYISAQGAAPADPGMSVGYVALQLDSSINRQLNPRTNQAGEHLNQ